MTTNKQLIRVLNEVRNRKVSKMPKIKRSQDELVVVAARKLYAKTLSAKQRVFSAGGNDPVINDIDSRAETLMYDIEQCCYDEPVIKTVLTIAHLDHDPTNNNPDNLRALCQQCHNRYDQKHRQANARQTRRARKAARELF